MTLWGRRTLLLALGACIALGGYGALEHAPGMPPTTQTQQLTAVKAETASLLTTAASLRSQIQQAKAILAQGVPTPSQQVPNDGSGGGYYDGGGSGGGDGDGGGYGYGDGGSYGGDGTAFPRGGYGDG